MFFRLGKCFFPKNISWVFLYFTTFVWTLCVTDAPLSQDGALSHTPTITTYKAVKRPSQDNTNRQHSMSPSPVKMSVTDKLPGSLQNIKKLSEATRWGTGWKDLHNITVLKVKVVFLYSAVSNPLDRSKRFTLFALPDRPVHSDTNSASPGSILARQQLRAKTKSLTLARYSFIQLSQHRFNGVKENANFLKREQRGIRIRAHLIASPTFCHWATALFYDRPQHHM